MLTSLQCRDFVVTGSFVRVDYSVDCSSSTYQSIIWLSTLGICIYSIGIPLLFGLVIRNRNNFLFERPSKLLYENYKDSFCYFEIFDMVRKFLLTSMLIFVTEPGRPSMALYLLIVNAVALRILCSFHPFRHLCDNILCIFLVSVECLVFLVAFIILSDVSEVDGYSENDVFASVFAIILTAVCLVAPLMFALKFDFCSKIFQSRFEQIFLISRLSWNGPSNQQQHDSKIELQIIAEVNPIASRITD
jgi:hypothetical protein